MRTPTADETHRGAAGKALQRDGQPHQRNRRQRAVSPGKLFLLLAHREGKQYPIYCRKQGSLDAKEEIVARSE